MSKFTDFVKQTKRKIISVKIKQSNRSLAFEPGWNSFCPIYGELDAPASLCFDDIEWYSGASRTWYLQYWITRHRILAETRGRGMVMWVPKSSIILCIMSEVDATSIWTTGFT